MQDVIANPLLMDVAPPPALAEAAPAAANPAPAAPVNHEAPADLPTQLGPKGLRYDFNDGCRVFLPESDHPWRVRLSDLDTGNILYETTLKSGRINSARRYYVRFRLEVWQQDEQLLLHDYSAKDRDVLVRFPVETLGDTMGWFPFAVKFQEKHNCRLTCAMNDKLIALYRDVYPHIRFIGKDDFADPERYYATYTVVLFFQKGLIYDYKDRVPCDFRFVGLHSAAAYILGVDPSEMRPRLFIPNDTRPIPERYVCIAVQSTMRAKYWNNPTGWLELVDFLKASGYRVFCIDLKRSHGQGNVWMHAPGNAEDLTGEQPLAERARWLKHADLFVGLSSGLSWLAWASGTPVVMISGFTHPRNEFATPYRVINYHVCNSCWNDPLAPYDRHDFFTCPRHKDTPRQFECTRLITSQQVIATVKRIPGFGVDKAARPAVPTPVEAAPAPAPAMPTPPPAAPPQFQPAAPAEAPSQLDTIIALNNRGLELQNAQRYPEALAAFDEVLALNPNIPEALYNRGNVLRDQIRLQDAVVAYDRAIQVRPNFVLALNNRGWVLKELGRVNEALADYDKALAIDPSHIVTLVNRGTLMSDMRRFDDALANFDAVIALQPDNPDILNNRGVALKLLNRPQESLESYDRALKLRPDHVQALGNRGVALQGLRRFDEAVADFNKALAVKPDHAEAHWDMAFFSLLRGNFERGWKEAEWRWEKKEIRPRKRNFSQPLWLGNESLKGKTILLHAEQGVGDTIQFSRYAPQVANLGGRVVVEVQPSLVTLIASLSEMTASSLEVIARGSPLPAFDFQCPTLSLPLAFGTNEKTIPTGIPYLKAPDEKIARWRQRLPPSAGPRVGLVWAGNPAHTNDQNRSIAIDLFAPLFAVPGMTFVGLQKNASKSDVATLERHGIRNFDETLVDFSDTAAIVSQLDLVVSVDTAAAHLAGALGKPVFLLLPHMPDWRWMLDRPDSPWYPSIRLFRQDVPGQWPDAIRQVAAALATIK